MSHSGYTPGVTYSLTQHASQHDAGVFNNVMGYHNPEVQMLLDTEWVELDEQKRGDMWKKIVELVAEDVPTIPLYYVPMVNTHSAKWADVITRPYGIYQTREDAYLVQ